jgi:cellulose synthase/poly-beta-1,6-N-acetylglucosamine synthase-like glycosyltransferase
MTIIGALYIITILLLLVFDGYLITKSYLIKITHRIRYRNVRAKFPKVNIYVPCKDNTNRLEGNIKSIIEQRYPKYTTYFIVGSKEDSAYNIIKQVISGKKNAKLVIAGKTETCSQKNHNLLAGIKHDNKADIFLFLDSDQWYGKDTIKNLIIPFSKRPASVCTSHHKFVQKSKGFTQLFVFNFLSYQYVLTSSVKSVWGGCIAIPKKLFYKLRLNQVWSKTCVDDITLTNLLRKKRIKTSFVPLPIIHFSENMSLKEALDWMVRQIMYVKYYLKGIWYVIILNYFLKIILLIFSLPLIFLFLNDYLYYYLIIYLIFVFSFIVSVGAYYRINNVHIPFFRITVYSIPLVCLGFFALMRSIIENKIHWGGITYNLKSNGEVKKVTFK